MIIDKIGRTGCCQPIIADITNNNEAPKGSFNALVHTGKTYLPTSITILYISVILDVIIKRSEPIKSFVFLRNLLMQ